MARLRWIVLTSLAALLPAPAIADDGTTVVATYEAPTVEVPLGATTLHGADTSFPDPTAGAATHDGRVDLGQVLLNVPHNGDKMTLEVVDAASPRVPVRIEAFRSTGGSLGATYVCVGFNESVDVNIGNDSASVTLRFLANDVTGACADFGAGYATRGEVRATFM